MSATEVLRSSLLELNSLVRELRVRCELVMLERDVARKALSASEARVAEMHAALTQERAARSEMAKTLDHVRSCLELARYYFDDVVGSFESVKTRLDAAATEIFIALPPNLSALPAVDGSGLPVVRA